MYTPANRNLFDRLAAIEAALVGDGVVCLDRTNDVVILTGSGAPTDGTSGTGKDVAGTGSLYIDHASGTLSINTNTKADPLWSHITSST